MFKLLGLKIDSASRVDFSRGSALTVMQLPIAIFRPHAALPSYPLWHSLVGLCFGESREGGLYFMDLDPLDYLIWGSEPASEHAQCVRTKTGSGVAHLQSIACCHQYLHRMMKKLEFMQRRAARFLQELAMMSCFPGRVVSVQAPWVKNRFC